MINFRQFKLLLNNLPSFSIGRSDGRCVQRADTYSAQINDSHLLDIPRLKTQFQKNYPLHDINLNNPYTPMLTNLFPNTIVARVRPRTSKGITDLL